MPADPIILVNTGRCGSTMLSNMVRRHPKLLSASELFISLTPFGFPDGVIDGPAFWSILSTPQPLHSWFFRHGLVSEEILYRGTGSSPRFRPETGIPPIMLMTLPHLTDKPDELFDEIASWAMHLPDAPAEQHHRQLLQWLCDRFGRETWVERSGALLHMVPMLVRKFPQARFVHLYRDGRETAMSMSRHPYFRVKVIFDHLASTLGPAFGQGASAGLEHKVPPAWRGLLPWTFDVEVYKRTDIPMEVFGALWSSMILAGTDALATLPSSRVLNLSYEKLIDRPAKELERFAAFIGPEMVDRNWISTSAAVCRYKPPTWTSLPHAARTKLEAACAPGLRRMGYL